MSGIQLDAKSKAVIIGIILDRELAAGDTCPNIK
jgi:hypothetical protein